MTSRESGSHPSPSRDQTCQLELDALVIEATGGCVQTFEELVMSYKRMVLAIGHRMSGNQSDAEDIAQQTFLRVFMNLSSFRKESSFSTWLISIARNESLMWKRKQSRYKETPMTLSANDGDEAPFARDVPDQHPDPELLCFMNECNGLLNTEIDRLSPEMQMALERCDFQGDSIQGAAQFLGITPGAVKTRRRRARLILRKRLKHTYFFATTGSLSLE